MFVNYIYFYTILFLKNNCNKIFYMDTSEYRKFSDPSPPI